MLRATLAAMLTIAPAASFAQPANDGAPTRAQQPVAPVARSGYGDDPAPARASGAPAPRGAAPDAQRIYSHH